MRLFKPDRVSYRSLLIMNQSLLSRGCCDTRDEAAREPLPSDDLRALHGRALSMST